MLGDHQLFFKKFLSYVVICVVIAQLLPGRGRFGRRKFDTEKFYFATLGAKFLADWFIEFGSDQPCCASIERCGSWVIVIRVLCPALHVWSGCKTTAAGKVGHMASKIDIFPCCFEVKCQLSQFDIFSLVCFLFA